MRAYNLKSHLDDIYQHFPEGERRPVIGITSNYGDATAKLGEGYYKQVVRAGGVPLLIPPVADRHVLVSTLERIDALLLSGGGDINPLFCGEEPVPQLGGINAERDLPELLITRLAFNRQLPILGICRGIQTMAVALDGKVAQHISTAIKHSQDADRGEATHSVGIDEGSVLAKIYGGATSLYVNSFHHQAVSDPGRHFRAVAHAADGLIEAIESTEYKSMIGVQWHPECLADDGLPLFQWLVGEARCYREAHNVHDRVLTLDTHCDTPMFFNQDIHFAHRDPKILVDLHKMTEGRQDATIMVAYLPQPTDQPRQYADAIFDRIETIVAENSPYLALARTPDDLWLNKRQGRKSIMLGIENGIALDGQLSNVKHFADRGVVYITLCHNGDNDLCDSARGTQTHNGVSQFGEQVIAEMNRLGIMVDLSHANEKSFYDALSISKTPIVCSHSSSRALCDHPRNLTDDQMRALAKAGGVCQITLYPGFLVKEQPAPVSAVAASAVAASAAGASAAFTAPAAAPTEATILDAMAHLDHAIEVMGIDHVGLGTDFDGDGGVPGLANASELLQYTRQLLARRYSEADIQKLWGGNFLRVMRLVQQSKS